MDEYTNIKEVIEPIISDFDYELVRLKWVGGQNKGNRKILQVMVEPQDGSQTSIEICEKISREASAVLDVEEVIEGEYNLEVSSPGLDRPLTRLKDFERFKDMETKIETRNLIDGRKRFTGKVQKTDEDNIEFMLKEGGAAVIIPLAEILEAKLVMTDELIQSVMKKGKKKKS